MCIEEIFFSHCYAGVAWSESLNNLNDKGRISVDLDKVSQAVRCGFLSESCFSHLPQLKGEPCHCSSHVRITLCATVYLLFLCDTE